MTCRSCTFSLVVTILLWWSLSSLTLLFFSLFTFSIRESMRSCWFWSRTELWVWLLLNPGYWGYSGSFPLLWWGVPFTATSKLPPVPVSKFIVLNSLSPYALRSRSHSPRISFVFSFKIWNLDYIEVIRYHVHLPSSELLANHFQCWFLSKLWSGTCHWLILSLRRVGALWP